MITNKQKDIITGSLLGDGCLRKKNRGYKDNCTFIKNQSFTDKDDISKFDYMKWMFDELLPFSSSIGEIKKKKGKPQYEFRTKAKSVFTDLEKSWYTPTKPKRTKIVPEDICISPLTLTVWFMDDGINYPDRRQAEICTQSFTEVENEFLVDKLSKLGIVAKVQRFRGKFNLYIGSNSYLDLINTIKPYCIWNCFKYKHDLSKYKEQTYASGELNGHSRLSVSNVQHIIKLINNGKKQNEVAKKYEIHPSAISRIVNGKRWSRALLRGGVLSHA